MRPDRQTVACLILILALTPVVASAGPIIEVSQDFVGNNDPIPTCGSFNVTIIVTNSGDTPLTVSEIGVVETSLGPRGWLSVSETDLYVLPGEENSAQFDIQVDASAYDVPVHLLGYSFLKSDAENNDSLIISVWVWLSDPDQVVFWDLLTTDWRLYTTIEIDRECVGLAVSSHGVVGIPGWRRQHLDYFQSGFECGTRDADKVYLNSGSPFVLINDGESVSLTTSIYQSGVEKDYHWRPAPGSSGLEHGGGGGYGSYVYSRTGRLLNRDGRIAMERTYFAPRTPPGHSNYIIVSTKIYSGDGLPHDHVTVGSAVDWDIPSDRVAINVSGTGMTTISGRSIDYVYMQGTDTVGSASCQPNANRFATEVLLHAWYVIDDGMGGYSFLSIEAAPWGAWSGPQTLLRDTSLARDGSPINPPEPDGQAWWDEIAAHQGFSGDPIESNQAIWLAYYHDFELAADDTLRFLTVLTTVRDGAVSNLASRAALAYQFYNMGILQLCYACCVGMVGDANGLGGDEPTIGDISVIIDALFVSGDWYGIVCLDEADVNQSGACNAWSPDVTISDISILIDYLFITGPSLGLPACYW